MQKNVELIDRYVNAVEDLDYKAMEELLADDYLGLGPSYGDSIRKPEAIANLKANVENLYQSIDYDRHRNMAVTVPDGPEQGEWVSNWAELTIVYKEDQKKVKLWTNTIYKIREGKIVKSMTFYNEADALEQLGYVFINPNDL
jgi:ketosteroid isomerase-like protein